MFQSNQTADLFISPVTTVMTAVRIIFLNNPTGALVQSCLYLSLFCLVVHQDAIANPEDSWRLAIREQQIEGISDDLCASPHRNGRNPTQQKSR